jgi:hypothetical protein
LAKGRTVKIRIQGADLKAPIEIVDQKILASFQVWSGLGTSSTDQKLHTTEPSFIIDWSRGTASAPPKELPRYELSFYADFPNNPVVYVVSYVFDPTSGRGYVYLPGRGENNYRLNVGSIIRGGEGNWFYSWRQWDDTARPVIHSGR